MWSYINVHIFHAPMCFSQKKNKKKKKNPLPQPFPRPLTASCGCRKKGASGAPGSKCPEIELREKNLIQPEIWGQKLYKVVLVCIICKQFSRDLFANNHSINYGGFQKVAGNSKKQDEMINE